MSQSEIEKIKEDLQHLQYRVGGAEYLIKVLTKRLSHNELSIIEKEIKETIVNYGGSTSVAKVLEESLRMLGN